MTGTVRRRLIVVTTALVCLAAADAWVRRMKPVLGEYRENRYERVCRRLQQHGMPAIVLMGSSRSTCALTPTAFRAETGRTAYNAATNGSFVTEWRLPAKRLFAHEQPSLVVLRINTHGVRANYAPKNAAKHLFTFPDLLEYLRTSHPSMDVVGNYLRHELAPAWATYASRFELKMWCEERLAAALPPQARQISGRAARYAESLGLVNHDGPQIAGAADTDDEAP